jgi:TetR/AcrR family transcriptional regulator, cholesterol catabolism regulator
VARQPRTPPITLALLEDGAKPSEPARRIENAALDLFYRQGFMGTTVREIMQACGQTPGALYNHFPSKDSLLYRLIRGGHDELDRALVDAAARTHDGPVSELWELSKAFTLWHTKRRRLALVANQEYQRLPPAERTEIVAIRRRVRSLFEDVLDRGCRAGVFDPPSLAGEDPARMAVMAMLEMMIRVAEWFRPRGDLTAEQVAALHADLVLKMAVPQRVPAKR